MAVHITREDVINELPGIIEQEGRDFVYEKPRGSLYCVNVFEGKGSCLIGRYLISKGVPADFFLSTNSISTGIGQLSENPEFQHYITMDADAMELLTDIQINQDQGTRWGDAYTNETGIAL